MTNGYMNEKHKAILPLMLVVAKWPPELYA